MSSVTNANLTLDHMVVADAALGVYFGASNNATYTLSVNHATFWSNPIAIQVSRSNSNPKINLSIVRSVFSENDTLVSDAGNYSSNFVAFTDNVWTH